MCAHTRMSLWGLVCLWKMTERIHIQLLTVPPLLPLWVRVSLGEECEKLGTNLLPFTSPS